MSHDFWLRPESSGMFACNVLDPPWNEQGGGGRGAQNHYSILETSEIAKVILRCPLWRPAPSAHLWCWVTTNYLMDGLALVDRLGFRYVRDFTWVKTDAEEPEDESELQLGVGQYARGSHETCLFAVRGNAMVPAPADRPKDVIFAPRLEHSRKPDKAFTEWFERVSPGPRLEMFARAERPGWVAFGNEVQAKVIAFPVGPDDDTPVCR